MKRDDALLPPSPDAAPTGIASQGRQPEGRRLGTNIAASGYAWRETGMTPLNLTSALLWLAGVALPIILLIALYLHPG